MKRPLIFLFVLITVIVGSISASAIYEPEKNYMEIMMDAAMEKDIEKGEAAQLSRDEKIDNMDLEYAKVDFSDMYLISKIIQAEAGSNWLSDEWKMAVGEVVINRVNSPEFPDTVQEVVEQTGQYYGKNSSFFNKLKPSERCVRAAKELLEGKRILNEPSVVFQSNFVLGSGVYLELKDSQLGTTYLCYSSHPELYKQ